MVPQKNQLDVSRLGSFGLLARIPLAEDLVSTVRFCPYDNFSANLNP